MEQKKKKGRYKQEFKTAAIQMVAAGKSASEVARELGIPDWLVQGWVRESKRVTTPPVGDDLVQENKRLKKELAKLQEETEILKKAAAYFARHQP